MTDPIDRVEWVAVDDLQANHYNPNAVARAELRLLEWSILQTGWVQPILVARDGWIIDGYHRWCLAKNSKAIHARYGGLVPVARLDVDLPEAMMVTVRMNRAKGTHVALRMSDLVKALIQDHGVPLDVIAQGIGATPDEVALLRDSNIWKTRNLANCPYSRAWVPREKRKDGIT